MLSSFLYYEAPDSCCKTSNF